MAIDFTLTPDHEEIRSRVRAFVESIIIPEQARLNDEQVAYKDHGTTKAAAGNLPI